MAELETFCIYLLCQRLGMTNESNKMLELRRGFGKTFVKCVITLTWLYSALPDSLLTGLLSDLGLRTWRSGLEIGRPVTLIPSADKMTSHSQK